MKDRVFTGADVPEALASAGRALGLPPEALRHHVLSPGRPGGLGVSATPAQIVVLLDSAPPPADRPQAPDARPPAPGDARGALRRILRQVAETAQIEIDVDLVEEEDTLRVRVLGPGRTFFFERDGEVLRAVEHLLQRMTAVHAEPRRLVLDVEGYREHRDEALRQRALDLAAAVRSDGKPRETPPLNAYERRIIHVALAEEPGLRTFSVGEGGDRRVTVAPAETGE